ncbi:MAG: hypothetical protein R3F59_04940 [Myxococcota bacterium]
MEEHEAFVERVFAHLPDPTPSSWTFAHWNQGGRPTDEGFGLLPVAGADPDKIVAAVMDVDHYQGNVEHVAECRSVPDPRFAAPAHVRFYQRVDLPMLGAVHHELVLHDLGTRNGWRVASWSVLRAETDALSPKQAFRSDYNHGAWIAKPGLVGYALGSAPKREDVGFVKWKVLTSGADVAASRVVRSNIEGMARWAARR